MAQTIEDALVAAYHHDPLLKVARLKAQVTGKEVDIAEAGFRPRFSVQADVGRRRERTRPTSHTDGKTNPKGFSATYSHSLFKGFQTVNAVNEADAKFLAAQEETRSKEQAVLFNAARIYLETYKNRQIVSLKQNDIKVAGDYVEKARQGFEFGSYTMLDISQAEARKELVTAEFHQANAELAVSQAEYLRAMGVRPATLSYPGNISFRLGLNEAIRIGLKENSLILKSQYRIEVAHFTIKKIRGERLPEVNLEANYDRRFEGDVFTDDKETVSLKLTAKMFLYQGGGLSARIEQANLIRQQSIEELNAAKLRVKLDITSSWMLLQSKRKQLTNETRRVKSNRTTLGHLNNGLNIGQRTLLDVLDGEAKLLDAKISLVKTRVEIVMLHFKLLAAIGRL